MNLDLQKAGMWKRFAAWMFDGILLSVVVVAFSVLLSWLLGYDGYSTALETGYARYEGEYGVVFEMTEEAYAAMTPEELTRYEEAYDALIGDEEAMYAYNMVINLTLMLTSLGILMSHLALEFAVPLLFGNGQTLGKKIFGIGLMRQDGVQINHLQLFVRTVLGKFTVETMIPVYILIMLFFNSIGLFGTLIVIAIALAQVILLFANRNGCVIHDLLAGTVAVDISSQMIFRTTEDLIAYQKKAAAQRAARAPY